MWLSSKLLINILETTADYENLESTTLEDRNMEVSDPVPLNPGLPKNAVLN